MIVKYIVNISFRNTRWVVFNNKKVLLTKSLSDKSTVILNYNNITRYRNL